MWKEATSLSTLASYYRANGHMIKRHQNAFGRSEWRMKVSWVVSPPSLKTQEDSEHYSIGIYTVPGWLIAHLHWKVNSELSHTHNHPAFPGCSFGFSVHYGKDQCTAFLLLSTKATCFSLILTSRLSSQMEVSVLYYSPRRNVCPPCVAMLWKERL